MHCHRASLGSRCRTAGNGNRFAGLISEWIRTQLEMNDERLATALLVRRRSVSLSDPDAPTLPTGARIVDAAVHPLHIEAQGIWHPQGEELPVHQCMDAVE